MNRGSNRGTKKLEIKRLIEELHHQDCSVDPQKLAAILSHRSSAIPHLEEILKRALSKGPEINYNSTQNNTGWFVVIHALYLLAHLHAEKSLPLVLEFLAQKQEILDYWLHDLLNEDIWEVVYLLGENRLEALETFVLNRDNNSFSRSAVCSALIQIALNNESKRGCVIRTFKRILKLKGEESDFIGLVINELMDLKEEALKPAILDALEKNQVWPGIISSDEVLLLYETKRVRAVTPLNLFEKYEYFKQYAYFSRTASHIPQQVLKLREFENSL